MRNIKNVNYKNAKKVFCVFAGTKKWLFHSEGAAKDAASFYFKNNGNKLFCRDGISARAYYCDACGGWHLTKMTLPQWKERQKEILRLRSRR